MHNASFVYIAYMLYIFVAKKNMKSIFVELVALYSFTYISVEAGYFIDVFGVRFGYARFVEMFVLIAAVILLIFYIVNGRLALFKLENIGLSLLCVIVGIINLILRPADVLVVNGEMLIDSVWNGKRTLQYPAFSNTTVSAFVAYLIFLLILYTVFLTFNQGDYLYILAVFVKYSKVLIVFGYVEFLLKLLISNQLYSNLLIFFWGKNDAISYTNELRNGLPILYGWTQEPSHFAYTLFVIMVAMLAQNYMGKIQFKWITASGLLLILTMAFSAFLFAVTFVAISYICRKRGSKHYLRRLLGIFAMVIGFIVIIWIIVSTGIFTGSFFGDRLKAIFDELPLLLKLDLQKISTLEYSSYRVRLVSSFTTLKLIAYRPLFGLGIGTITSHGSSATILSSIGIIGTYLWLKAMFGGISRKFTDIERNAYRVMIIIWFVMGIFMSHFYGMLYGGENYVLIVAFAIMCKKSRRIDLAYKGRIIAI